MAEIGRRQEVQDPLAMNPLRRDTERSLPTYGVRNPMQSGGDAATRQGLSALNVIDGLQAVAGRIFQQAAQTSLTEGKLAYMQGATEQEIEARGDKYVSRGWQSMESANKANEWFMQEAQFIQDEGNKLSPDEYRARMMDSRKQALENLGGDPATRDMWAAAFEDLGPRLTRMQVEQHNEYNKARTENELYNMLTTGSQINTDASVRQGGFRISQEQVRTPLLNQTDEDRDFGIRTLLGEAAGEGQQGMAAVAHVVMNRMGSKRFGYKTVKDAVLADKQFSTWNTGEGGNNPNKWDPNSAQYKRAAEVWDAVTQGRHVDPTGGSTHYYSPKGMKSGRAPDWWNEEAKNGEIRIGNHVFAAAGRPGNGPKGELGFTNKGQNQLEGNFKSILEEVAGEFGGLTINSGYRSPGHNKAVGGAKGSRHMHGDAADIDMTGMSDADRAKLVDSLRAKGAKGFITYTNSPNMLHVDMLDRKGDGKAHYMFDKSSENLGRAPAWFRQMADTDVGGTNVQRRGSQVQAVLDASPAKPADKARVLAKAMTDSLSMGDDTLFNDAGGVSYLYGLGATPSDISSVLKAKERFDEENDKKFDLQRERIRSDFLARVQSGEFGSEEEMGAELDRLVYEEGISDGEAKAIYRKVAEDMRKGENKVVPIGLRELSLDLYERVVGGNMEPGEAAASIENWAKEQGVDPKIANNFMAKMFDAAQSRNTQLRNDAKSKFEKAKKNEQIKKSVEAALVNGAGLATVTGTMEIVDDNGNSKSVSAKEYGVSLLKQQAAKTMQDFMTQAVRPGMNPAQIEMLQGQAETDFYKNVYEPLRKQGVYDVEFGNQMAAAVSGTILGPDGQITEDAQRAVDAWLQLRNNPRIGEEYVTGMIKDPRAREFFETVNHLMDGRKDLGQAMMRANTIMSQTISPEDKLERNAAFTSKAYGLIKDAIAGNMDVDWWKYKFGFPGVARTPREEELAAKRNAPVLEGYVYDRAKQYKMDNPRLPDEVAVKQAAQDLQLNSVVVGTDVILGNYRNGTRLDQVMGLEGMEAGKEAPHKAITSYMENVVSKLPEFQNLWNEQVSHGVFRSERDRGLFKEPNRPHFGVSYSPIDGSLELQLYKDEARTQPAGKALYVPASQVGSWYRKNVSEGNPNLFQRAWRWGVDTIADVGQADGSDAFVRALAEENNIPLN